MKPWMIAAGVLLVALFGGLGWALYRIMSGAVEADQQQ